MGQEITTAPVKITKFLGINRRIAETELDIREARDIKNVNITEESLEQRRGSIKLNSTAFKDKAGVNPVAITGLYQTLLNTSLVQIGIGGDAIREDSSTWNDITGGVSITSNDNVPWYFSTFVDGSSNEIVIASNGVDLPIKWTGAGNAQTLSSPPANFKFQVVHKNKLWVSDGDFLYVSALLNGESWDLVDDVFRFLRNGEEITALRVYGDRVAVFQETAIHLISGSSSRDLFIQTTTNKFGCESGASVREIPSRKYGNILIFVGRDGVFRGYNGTKNIIELGENAEGLFKEMNRDRLSQVVGGVYETLGQYWAAYSLGSGVQNDQILIYDYINDRFVSDKGRPLSAILRHTGIKAASIGEFTASGTEMLVTGSYDGFALRQDIGVNDSETTAVDMLWKSGKIDFGDSSVIKLLTDVHLSTSQRSAATLTSTVSSEHRSGVGSATLSAGNNLWGTLVWGTGLWSGEQSSYTRFKYTPQSSERAISGRYLQHEITHNAVNESVEVNEIVMGITNLGQQPEYVDA